MYVARFLEEKNRAKLVLSYLWCSQSSTRYAYTYVASSKRRTNVFHEHANAHNASWSTALWVWIHFVSFYSTAFALWRCLPFSLSLACSRTDSACESAQISIVVCCIFGLLGARADRLFLCYSHTPHRATAPHMYYIWHLCIAGMLLS